MNDYIVCNFSGGKDSTAMVLRMIELGETLKQGGLLPTLKKDLHLKMNSMQEVRALQAVSFTGS